MYRYRSAYIQEYTILRKEREEQRLLRFDVFRHEQPRKGIYPSCDAYVLDINITRKEDKAMEGSGIMSNRLSSEQQIVSITRYMREKLDNLNNLSEEERKKEAMSVLVGTGLFDNMGNFIVPDAGENNV
jgi:hypothetical protein